MIYFLGKQNSWSSRGNLYKDLIYFLLKNKHGLMLDSVNILIETIIADKY